MPKTIDAARLVLEVQEHGLSLDGFGPHIDATHPKYISAVESLEDFACHYMAAR
jgi:hypothetical protein